MDRWRRIIYMVYFLFTCIDSNFEALYRKEASLSWEWWVQIKRLFHYEAGFSICALVVCRSFFCLLEFDLNASEQTCITSA